MGPTEDRQPDAYQPQHLANIIAAVREPLPQLKQVGPYKIEELIGEGGMGQVYRAEQHEPIRRTVAIKVIKPGYLLAGRDTRQVIARFDAERQTLAMMDHPNVATVLDAGATEHGRPYFVMEHVDGEPITSFCDREKFSLPQRLELFQQACEAVQHAHQKAIIHRDLKPSNILVTRKGEHPWVKVIDFGVAKAIDQRTTEKSLFTEAGQLVGTPEYMAPEQADGNQLDIDTRTDVYSLGVVLYELLAGALPFDGNSLRSRGYAEIQRIIREVDPPRPSTKLSGLGETAQDVARARQTQLETLQQTLRGELEWIPLKAMRKERDQRYASAKELYEDVANYLAQRPLRAGPESRAYRTKKFLRRNKRGVAALAAMFLLLITGIVATSWQAIRATRAEGRALDEKREADRQRQAAVTASENVNEVNLFLTELLAAANPDVTRGKEMSVHEAVNRAAEMIPTRFRNRPLSEGAVREALSETYAALGDDNRALIHAQAARDIYVKHYGPDAQFSIIATLNVGKSLDQLKRHAEAEPLTRGALERARRVIGNDHDVTIQCIGGLAQSLRLQERFAEAEPLYREALDACRRKFPADSERVAQAVNNLAVLLNTQRRAAEAEPLYREALAIREKNGGTDHPAYLTSLSNLSRVLHDQGKLVEAEAMTQRVVREKKRVLKEDHPSTLLSMNALATVLFDLSRVDEAIAIQREVLERRTRVLGADDRDTLQSSHNLGTTLGAARQFEESAVYLERAAAGRERLLGPTHAHTVNSWNGLSRVYEMQGRWAKLEPLMVKLSEPERMKGAPSYVARAAIIVRLGRCRLKLGRPADAEEPLRQAYAMVKSSQSPTSPDLKREVLIEMIDLSEKLNRPDDVSKYRAELAESGPATTPTKVTTTAPIR